MAAVGDLGAVSGEMSENPGDQPRPSPRRRPVPAPRPSPRPRVAGARRDREDATAADVAATAGKATGATTAEARPAERSPSREEAAPARSASAARRTRADRASRTRTDRRATAPSDRRRRLPALALVLGLLCLAAAAGVGVLLWQRQEPRYVDPSVLSATESGVQALYAYDYRDSEGSVQGKLDVLTGELREQYETDLGQGGIIETYEQVSATTSYEVLDVGLQQISDDQDAATLVVFGEYVVQSVTSGEQPAPEGSECQVTAEGAQSCVQTIQVGVLKVDGEWKINEVTLLTTS